MQKSIIADFCGTRKFWRQATIYRLHLIDEDGDGIDNPVRSLKSAVYLTKLVFLRLGWLSEKNSTTERQVYANQMMQATV
ncbi:hypothetical protein MKW92_041140, partial [Papaver armeniacum]